MTREEINEIIYGTYDIDEIIERIISYTESRICENCTHLYDGYCMLSIEYNDMTDIGCGNMKVDEDFGCNKFEAKLSAQTLKAQSRIRLLN